jgi:hypothetical protein
LYLAGPPIWLQKLLFAALTLITPKPRERRPPLHPQLSAREPSVSARSKPSIKSALFASRSGLPNRGVTWATVYLQTV